MKTVLTLMFAAFFLFIGIREYDWPPILYMLCIAMLVVASAVAGYHMGREDGGDRD